MDTKNTLKFIKLFTFFLLIISFTVFGQDQIENGSSSDVNVNSVSDDGNSKSNTNDQKDLKDSDDVKDSDNSSQILPMAIFILVFLAFVFVILKYMSNLYLTTKNSDESKLGIATNLVNKVKAFFKKDAKNDQDDIELNNDGTKESKDKSKEGNEDKSDKTDEGKDHDSFKIDEDTELENIEDNESNSVNDNNDENKSSSIPNDSDLDKALKNVVLQNIKKWFSVLNNKVVSYSEKSLENQKKMESLSGELVKTIADLNSTMDFQQKEIDRLKQGYDYKIKKDSFIALIGLNDTVSGFINESDNEQMTNKLSAIKKNIDSYLSEMDIKSFTIDPGKSYREISSNKFEANTIDTDDENLHEKIEKTVKEGYIHKHDNGENIVRPAIINIYKFKKEEKKDE